MGIGSSKGAYYKDEFAQSIGKNENNPGRFDLSLDKNVVDPAEGLANKYKDEPLDVFSGNYDNMEMTDSALMRNTLNPPGFTPISGKMPFPDNNNPDTDFNSRFGTLPPSGILNDIKPQPDKPLIRRISDIKTTTGVTITDDDIEKGMNLGLAFAGGGLSTKKVTPFRKAANDNINNPADLNLTPAEKTLNEMNKLLARFGRGNQIIEQRGELMDKLRDSGLNDLEKQKLKNLNKEHEEHFGGYSLD